MVKELWQFKKNFALILILFGREIVRYSQSFFPLDQWRAVRLLVDEAQFFFTHMFAKKLFKTIKEKQMVVFIAIKPGLPNPWPVGHIWPAKLFCVARKIFLRGWFPHGKAYLAFSGNQTKTFFCLVLPKSVRICGEDLFFLVFAYFLGQIPEILAKVSTDFVQQTCNYLEFNLGKNACGPQ